MESKKYERSSKVHIICISSNSDRQPVTKSFSPFITLCTLTLPTVDQLKTHTSTITYSSPPPAPTLPSDCHSKLILQIESHKKIMYICIQFQNYLCCA